MDLMSVCRTCMSSTTLNPIFPLPEVHERFSKAIQLVTGVKVTLNDGLPQHMCIDCLKQVNDAMKFRAKCKETEESLIKIKHELRRAERHNAYVTDSNNLIREIKVDNRWVKIYNTETAATPEEDEDNQPLVHLLNAQTDNIYLNESDGQIIPLEMLKVELDASNIEGNNYDQTMNDQEEPADENYSINEINDTEYLVTEADNSINEQEDNTDNQEDNMIDHECSMDDEETIMNEQEATVKHEKETNNQEDANDHQEYVIENPLDTVNDQKNACGEPEYTITITNLEGNFNNHSASEKKPEQGNLNDPANSDLLKTYYIMKESESDNETAEPNETQMDATDNPDFDNINISENQDIIVMDNKESLYVIDMSNPSSKRVTCKLCQKNLSIRSIDMHLSKSHPGADGRRIKCQLCDNFVIREKMVQHRLVMHGAEAYQCRYCKSEFQKENLLIEHVVTCTARKKRKACDSGKKLVECEICHKKMQKASLRLHTSMKHNGLRPVCDHCGRSFSNTFRLYEHCRARHGYEKYKCGRCDFESASRLALRNHERRHSGEKPYVCERCGAKFHASYLLLQHRHSHRTDRRYKCEVCGVRFKTNNGLHSHRRACHGGRRLRPADSAPINDVQS